MISNFLQCKEKEKYSNLRTLLSITFPQGFWKSNILDVGLQEVGAKKTLNGVGNTDTKKILLSKAKIAQKLFFFCRATLHPLFVKVFESETTNFHFFFPRIQNL